MRQTRSTLFPGITARAITVLALLTVAAAVLPLGSAGAVDAKPLFEQIGSLERFAPDARAILGDRLVPEPSKADFEQKGRNGTAFMIPETRQLWQIYQSPGGSDWAAVVRDLDSLRIVKTLPLPFAVDRGTQNLYAGEWAHAVDMKGLRLFLVSASNREMIEVDLRTFAWQARQLPAGLNPDPPSNGLIPLVQGGITYDSIADDLLLLYGGPPNNSAGDTNTFLYTMDVSTAPSPAKVENLHHLSSCTGPLSSLELYGTTYGWEILAAPDFLYIPCQRAGNAGTVLRMARPGPANARPRQDVVVGPVNVDAVLADPASGRMFLTTMEREIWTFETTTMSFIGVVATGPQRTQRSTGYGLDRQTGRLFFQSPSFGLGVVEGRFFPIPQARTMPKPATGQERILSDVRTGRVFVLEGEEQGKAPAYRIYRTEVAPVPPPSPDPDRNTIDMAEREGVTEPRYFAGGSGYGMRALIAKGLATVAPAPTVGSVSPTASAIDKNVSSKCGYTDRELVAGRVRKAEYDTGSTSASAIAFDVDGATRQDLDKPSRCDVTVRDSNGTQRFNGIFGTAPAQVDEHIRLDERTQAKGDDPATPDTDESEPRWAADTAECTSSDEAGSGSGRAEFEDYGPSTVECPTPGGSLTARATATFTGGVTVAKAWTETKIERTAGVRSTVTAVAQGVDIAGVIQFAEIRSVATSASNGRPKQGNMSTHDVVFHGLRIEGTTVCDDCSRMDLPSLVDTLNLVAGGKAIFRTAKGTNSGLDEKLLQGSKRGALTAVQKSAARQASDRALVGDFTTEVPGLEMTVFNDNTDWGRARQVYQFAGVSTAATYNIVLRPTGIGFDDEAALFEDGLGGTDGDPFSGVAQAIDSPTSLDGTVPASEGGGRGEGGGVMGALRALAQGIRLFLTNPRHSLLLLTAWALFSLPGILARRRRLLAGL